MTKFDRAIHILPVKQTRNMHPLIIAKERSRTFFLDRVGPRYTTKLLLRVNILES